MQETIITTLNTRMASSSILIKIIPILGDIFVFTYPIYLLYIYFSHSESISRWKKILHISENSTNKINALTIIFATASGVIINYIFKAFISEARPYESIALAINPQESLILNSIPTDSFPSDHATVGMTVALTTLILAYRYNKKSLIIAGWCFFAFALIMDICRITIGVHRPSDILGGIGVAILVSLIITYIPIATFLTKKIYTPLIRFQEYIFERIMK